MANFTGTGGGDSIRGNANGEADSVLGLAGNDTIDGRSGNDTIIGGEGNDRITAGTGTDSVVGGADHDSIYGGAEADTITGDTGNDTIFGDSFDLTDAGTDSIVGGDGNDLIFGGQLADTLVGGDGADTIIGDGTNQAATTDYNDSIVGGDGDDSISSAGGADTIDAGGGNDTIRSGADNDFVIGGTGNDFFTDAQGGDTFAWAPGQGSDTVLMQQGNPADVIQINIGGFNVNAAGSFFGMPTTIGAANAINGFELVSGQNLGNPGVPAVYRYIATGEILNTEGVASFIACFYPGTMIATPDGERAVETLAMGDLVITAEGLVQPVRWMGRQTVSTRFGDPLRILPVRISAGALADGVPARDLLLSPDHAVLVEGVLIQAGALVNGTTILRQSDVPEIFTYHHIELAAHDLILAEGAPAETFVDNIDRLAFDNWDEHEALYGNEPSITEMDRPRAKAQRQVPRSVQRSLDARARLKTTA